MTEEKRHIYAVNYRYETPSLVKFLILKETKKLYKIREVSRFFGYANYFRQVYKDDPHIFLDVNDAINWLLLANTKYIESLQKKNDQAYKDANMLFELQKEANKND